VQVPGVPAFFFGGELIIGYRNAETTGRQIKALLDRYLVSSQERETIDTFYWPGFDSRLRRSEWSPLLAVCQRKPRVDLRGAGCNLHDQYPSEHISTTSMYSSQCVRISRLSIHTLHHRGARAW
jgi:hypothetical protein